MNQQVTVIEPEIGTTAVDGADGDKLVSTDDAATVVDRPYKNLIPGRRYTVVGALLVKKTDDEGKVTDEPLKVDGKPVMADTTFTPETADGTVDVTFTFDSLSLKDKTHLVAFDSLEPTDLSLRPTPTSMMWGRRSPSTTPTSPPLRSTASTTTRTSSPTARRSSSTPSHTTTSSPAGSTPSRVPCR